MSFEGTAFIASVSGLPTSHHQMQNHQTVSGKCPMMKMAFANKTSLTTFLTTDLLYIFYLLLYDYTLFFL